MIIADSRAQENLLIRDSLSYEMMADDYAALLDVMKIDSAYVVGWSDGGINGLLMAIRHPEKVKKLAVTGANLRPDTTAVPQVVWDMVTPVYAGLKAKPDKNEMEKGGYKLLKLLVENPHIPLSDLQKISCPTLVIGGDHDVIKKNIQWRSIKIFQMLIYGYCQIQGIAHQSFIQLSLILKLMTFSKNLTGRSREKQGFSTNSLMSKSQSHLHFIG